MGFYRLDGLEDGRAFSPAQRKALRRLAARLRRYSRKATHYHDHGPGTKLGRLRPPMRRQRTTDLPIDGWEDDGDDEELGFLSALLPIISSVAGPLLKPLLGGGGGGGKKSAAAPAPAAVPTTQAPIMMNGPPAPSLAAIGGVISDQIRAVPPPVRQQVTDAIRESMDRHKAGMQTASELMGDIRKQLGPTIKAQLDKVNRAQLQRQATFEHNSIVNRDKRWKANAEAQTRILARMNDMERTLGGAITQNNRRRNQVAKAFGVPPRLRG